MAGEDLYKLVVGVYLKDQTSQGLGKFEQSHPNIPHEAAQTFGQQMVDFYVAEQQRQQAAMAEQAAQPVTSQETLA
jgi:hypothetical protein